MAISVVMPALEMAQETGKLISWRKKEGDRVQKGEPLIEIETDKAVVEVEAPADGLLVGIKAAAGADIPVGKTIAWIVAPGEAPPLESDPSAPTARQGSGQESRPAGTPPTAASGPLSAPAGVKISPKARRLAKELEIDIRSLSGSGPGGEILVADVEAARTAKERSGKTSSNLEVAGSVGRIMAKRTTESWTTVPHFFVTREMDATSLQDYRNRISAELEQTHPDPAKIVRITHTDLLVALVARALLRHPRLNASWTAEGIRTHDHVNMGIAIAVNDGVVAGVIPHADSASLAQIARRRVEVTERAFAGRLQPIDIAGATFTISNLGMYHVDQFSAIITPPQAAILAVGAIADRVVAIEGRPAVRPRMALTLSCDHRVADGVRAALFLNDLAEAVRQPGKSLEPAAPGLPSR
jgi:pyruvate dehydrogenase E2 component (dihydrolipoamide acetyltransferase)